MHWYCCVMIELKYLCYRIARIVDYKLLFEKYYAYNCTALSYTYMYKLPVIYNIDSLNRKQESSYRRWACYYLHSSVRVNLLRRYVWWCQEES